jgi:hypothetical protein
MRYTNLCRFSPPPTCYFPHHGGGGRLISSFENRIDRDKVQKRNPWRRGRSRVEKRLGYTLDLNGDGRYSRGVDGVLTFDMNGDGKYNRRDAINTNKMMQAAANRFDFDGDGRVSRGERAEGLALRSRFSRIDSSGDGRLSTQELARAGGKVWIDKSGGGGVQDSELHSVFQVPDAFKGGRPGRLDAVDPMAGTSRLRHDGPRESRYHCHTKVRPCYHRPISRFFFAFFFGRG